MGQKILIVDDDASIRLLLDTYLKRQGYTVLTAHDGPTAIDLYRTEQPDLVVMDIAMPKMDGFETATHLRAIQAEEDRPHTPIIVLTAYARSFFVSTGTEPYIDSYQTKPISPDQLVRHIRQFLDG
ncbi:MAG: response regulator [Chloroflexi bacterium]|jgi:OmpR family response regulator RpaB|nr:response regulator [Chloroflexota bacterium]